MVEVVITLAESDQGCDNVVSRRIPVIERLLADPVGERVNAEGSLLDEEDAKDSCIHKPARPIAPAQACHESRYSQAHRHENLQVVTVLPYHNGVCMEVRDIRTTDPLRVLLHNHPADMRVEQALANRVRVSVGIRIAVVGAMVAGPRKDRPFNGSPANGREPDPERESS